MKLNFTPSKDPCLRPFFIRDADLLPDWAQVHFWKPSDGMEMTPSIVFPWNDGAVVKFSTNMVINRRTIAVLFWGVN